MGFIMKYKMVVAVIGITILEGVLFAFLLPSSKVDAAKDAQDEHDHGHGHKSKSTSTAKSVEFSLTDDKDIRINNLSEPSAPIRVDCKVAVTIDDKKSHEFEEMLKRKKFRAIEAVQTVLRKASQEILSEAELSTLKRQIKVVLNEIFGKEHSIVEEVVIPEFKTTSI